MIAFIVYLWKPCDQIFQQYTNKDRYQRNVESHQQPNRLDDKSQLHLGAQVGPLPHGEVLLYTEDKMMIIPEQISSITIYVGTHIKDVAEKTRISKVSDETRPKLLS